MLWLPSFLTREFSKGIIGKWPCNGHFPIIPLENCPSLVTRLPNDPMLKIWLNIKNQLLQEETQKLGNVMQRTMHSYICGTNLRSERSLILSDLLFA